jgi:hypothetical protein
VLLNQRTEKLSYQIARVVFYPGHNEQLLGKAVENFKATLI